MSERFVVRPRSSDTGGPRRFLVVDTEDRERPVAEYDDRGEADDHAAKLNGGPLDWDEQEQWQDDWDDDWEDDDW